MGKQIYWHLNTKQILFIAKIDSKFLWESINNSRKCEEKMLRNTIAGIKELLDLKMLHSVDWVSTEDQLADCLTKKGMPIKSDWVLEVEMEKYLLILQECSTKGGNVIVLVIILCSFL